MAKNTETPGTSAPSLEDRIAALEAKTRALEGAVDRHADALTIIHGDLDIARKNGGVLPCPVDNLTDNEKSAAAETVAAAPN